MSDFFTDLNFSKFTNILSVISAIYNCIYSSFQLVYAVVYVQPFNCFIVRWNIIKRVTFVLLMHNQSQLKDGIKHVYARHISTTEKW